MRYQRLKLARDIGEFAKFAVRTGEFLMYLYDPRTKLDAMPLPLPPTKWDSYTATVVSWRTELFQKQPPYFDADAAYDMSSFMPLPMMAEVVLAPGLPANIKRDIGLAVWTRAVLLDDADTAKAMADVVAPFFPQYADSWKSYRGATSADTKKVEAALLLLKLPAARPYPDSGLGYMYKRDVIGRFGPRWWASGDTPFASVDDHGNPLLCSDCAMPLPLIAPPFITDRDKADAKADNERLSKLPGAPAFLGSIIIAWAKEHLSDPRVPEALHNVVRATEYGDHGLRHIQGRLRAPAQSLPKKYLDHQDAEVVLTLAAPAPQTAARVSSSSEIKQDAARGCAAVALLPSKETLTGAYLDPRGRID